MKIKVEKVTPLMAKRALNKNNMNRNLNVKRVEHWTRLMKAGQWAQNGEAIKFAKDGTLLDGQHRLAAVIAYGKPVEMLVVRGLNKNVMATLDNGVKRRIADHLKIAGYEGNTSQLGAACVICMNFETGKFSEKKMTVSPQDAINYVKKHNDLWESCSLISNNRVTKSLLPLSIATALHYLFSKIDASKAKHFFDQLETGDGLDKTSPVLKLRSQLTLVKSKSKRDRVTRKAYISYVCSAFQAYLNDIEVTVFFKYSPSSQIVLPVVGKRKKVKKRAA